MKIEATMDRRRAIKWMLAAAGAASAVDPRAFAAVPDGKGYGSDPNLMESYKPGDLWPLTFSAAQRETAAALCEVILPGDANCPGAKQLGVHEFIDEWISAPYPRQQKDRPIVIEGLDWLAAETKKRFQKSFPELNESQQRQICDDICYEPKAERRFREAARFFARFRDLTCAGFYTTPEGMKDVGYSGNVPLTQYDGPSADVLAFLKLNQP
jgi:hypothetical protein